MHIFLKFHQITISIQRGPNALFSTSLVSCDLQDFQKVQVNDRDAIRVTVLLKFDPGSKLDSFNAYEIRRQIELAPEFPGIVGIDLGVDKTATFASKIPKIMCRIYQRHGVYTSFVYIQRIPITVSAQNFIQSLRFFANRLRCLSSTQTWLLTNGVLQIWRDYLFMWVQFLLLR